MNINLLKSSTHQHGWTMLVCTGFLMSHQWTSTLNDFTLILDQLYLVVSNSTSLFHITSYNHQELQDLNIKLNIKHKSQHITKFQNHNENNFGLVGLGLQVTDYITGLVFCGGMYWIPPIFCSDYSLAHHTLYGVFLLSITGTFWLLCWMVGLCQ